MRMRTPLAQIRGLGPAREGTGHFWYQRLTAIANIPLTLFLVISIVINVGRDHQAVTAYLGSPLVSIALLMFIVSVVFHMSLGMQVIIEDYVQHEGLKIMARMSSTFFSIVIGFASIYAVLKLGFGG